MSANRWLVRTVLAAARFLVAFAFVVGALGTIAGAARAQTSPTFRFNNTNTTPFGPAYADIWTQQTNFLMCKPPVAQSFSYALCFFSGPAVATGSSANPPLPCTLSADGTSANCTCYGLTTDQYPPIIPYFVDINGILNLDEYADTVNVCGQDGSNCSSQSTPPICTAVNMNAVIPNADLISVFSPVKNGDYTSSMSSSNSTTCPAGNYAGCMTAPCYHTGKYDSSGTELVQCQCPVYNGPFEIGQGNAPCDANALTPPGQATSGTSYVWSAAHNPAVNHPPIDPPQTGCLPDSAGDKGCPLYSPTTSYPVTAGSTLCADVCKSYKTGLRQSTAIQVGFTCDSTICTATGIGQSTASSTNPLAKATLVKNACTGLSTLSGLQAILALEAADQCSCCASQVCGCDEGGTDIDAPTQAQMTELNAAQRALGITPQCDINGTLCGATSLAALQAAVLPGSASVQVGNTATAFASVINAGPGIASSCSIAPVTSIPATFTYQTTNPATNALTGTANTPVDIAQGATQSFVIAFALTDVIPSTDVLLTFGCANASPAPPIVGVNTLNLSASTDPVPNIVALVASGDPGYVDIPGATGTGDFAVATVNLGIAAAITATANTGSVSLPVKLSLCQTNPTSGNCLASPQTSVTTTIAANATPTFGVFVAGSGTVSSSPGVNRVFVTFTDSNACCAVTPRSRSGRSRRASLAAAQG
jgi:hypothetical protein